MVHFGFSRATSVWWQGVFLAGCALLLLPAPVLAGAEGLDLRVLVDVSGSMKQNDPANLRQPAVRLLVGLLPASGMRAGVWMFDEKAEPLQPVGEVTRTWKEEARRRAGRIHSRGQFTDIGGALLAASADWPEGSDGRRAILLLTDGMVDVAKDPAVNAAARNRVLEEILPQLRARGVTLYTVALSDGADHELMKALAEGTDGWHEQAQAASELERLFLRMFEQSARPDTLPLVDNRFVVDASIEQMNVLVFHEPGAGETELEMPDGTRLSRGSLPRGVSWAHEENYDLVTVYRPAAGNWRVVGAQDPDNRVMVVTNLQLQSKPLPNHLLAGEKLEFAARVVQEGEVAAGEQFLKVLTLTLTHYPAEGEPRTWTLQGPQRSPEVTLKDGIYRVTLGELSQGRHEFELTLDGKSFQRQKSQSVMVTTDAVQVTPLEAGPGGQPGLRVTVDDALLDPASVTVKAVAEGVGGARVVPLAHAGESAWEGRAVGLKPGASYQVNTVVQGRTSQGREVTLQGEPLTLSVKAVAPVPKAGINWPLVGLVVVLLNALGAGGTWLLRRHLRSRHARHLDQMVAGLEP